MASQRLVFTRSNGVPTLAERPNVNGVPSCSAYSGLNPWVTIFANSPFRPKGVLPADETTALDTRGACSQDEFSSGFRSVVTDSGTVCVPFGSNVDFSSGGTSQSTLWKDIRTSCEAAGCKKAQNVYDCMEAADRAGPLDWDGVAYVESDPTRPAGCYQTRRVGRNQGTVRFQHRGATSLRVAVLKVLLL